MRVARIHTRVRAGVIGRLERCDLVAADAEAENSCNRAHGVAAVCRDPPTEHRATSEGDVRRRRIILKMLLTDCPRLVKATTSP